MGVLERLRTSLWPSHAPVHVRGVRRWPGAAVRLKVVLTVFWRGVRTRLFSQCLGEVLERSNSVWAEVLERANTVWAEVLEQVF